LGYGQALGRSSSKMARPSSAEELARAIAAEPEHPLTAARADLLRAVRSGWVAAGRIAVQHRWPQASILASALAARRAVTVHPGIGYDIISNHPMFSGSVIGRAAGSISRWSAFDRSAWTEGSSFLLARPSWLRSLRKIPELACIISASGGPAAGIRSCHLRGDLQDGGGWDWSAGEPPRRIPPTTALLQKLLPHGAPMQVSPVRQRAFIPSRDGIT